MSFQDVGRRGSSSGAPPMAARPRTSAAALAAKQKQRNEKELSGLLYGNMKLVPSTSYETADESEQIGSLEFSSCSESLSGRSLPSESPPSRRRDPPSGAAPNSQTSAAAAAAATTRTEAGSPSRGIAGFSTHRRSKNHVAQSNKARAPLQPRGWTEVEHYSSNNRRAHLQDETTRMTGASSPVESRGTSANVHKENSKFSELNTEIKHFSKMVAQLETLLQQCAESPEVQWRARILTRSAQEADRDIADKLYWYEKSLVDKGRKKEARTSQTACMKLHRDFRRVHKTLDEALCEYERRQREDVSLLGAAVVDQQDGSSFQVLQQEQEDFFERATREREAEIKSINHKMHKVNEIYKELATLVDSQQEQIDVVQENVQDAKDTVEGGLRHIEYARDRLCAMGGDDSYAPQTCGGGSDDVAADGDPPRKSGKSKVDYDRLYPSSVGESEIFHWSMPFQTFHKDIKAVQKDILGLGNDIASMRLPENMGACGSLNDIHCGGTKKDTPSVVGSSLYNDDDDDSL